MGTRKIIAWLSCSVLVFTALLNFLGVFLPEIGFDALWYHLTLPKLWLLKRQWHFDGGLLYYSVMPRLTESLFIPLIKYTGTVGPKLVQFLSSLLTCLLIWKFTKKLKLSNISSLLAVTLFYVSWLVSWESSSAYIDLFRTALETFALYNFVFGSTLLGGIFLGLALGTKWLVIGSLLIYCLVFGPRKILISLALLLPWMLLSYHFTGNPVYPLFSDILQHSFHPAFYIAKQLLLPWVHLTIPVDDFINPLMAPIFTLATISMFSYSLPVRKIAQVSVLGTISVFFLDPSSARFMLPYLPGMVVVAIYQISSWINPFQAIFKVAILLSALFVLSLRLYVFPKNIPYLLGRETTNQYLTKLSYRLPDTFIDSDGFVQENLSSQDKILIDRLHNLYYFPYDFDHTSWSKTVLGYDYLITTQEEPANVRGELLNTNSVGIQVFKLYK